MALVPGVDDVDRAADERRVAAVQYLVAHRIVDTEGGQLRYRHLFTEMATALGTTPGADLDVTGEADDPMMAMMAGLS